MGFSLKNEITRKDSLAQELYKLALLTVKWFYVVLVSLCVETKMSL